MLILSTTEMYDLLVKSLFCKFQATSEDAETNGGGGDKKPNTKTCPEKAPMTTKNPNTQTPKRINSKGPQQM